MKIVECVPNFSEGRDRNIISKIAAVIEEIDGVSLLDVDPGEDTNRTVFTFVGEPEKVFDAAFNAIKAGISLIDMRKHKGAHPRMGACDVCPFIPVSGITMEECAELAKKLGKKVGDELGIPVYLYENAATSEERRNLANIRKGEYEALKEKLKDPQWKPDFGPSEFNEHTSKTGATVIGAREFLIAYNINLNSKDKKLANKIAKEIREKGKTIKDENGNKIQVPGKLKYCKAIGWYVEDYKRAQISINLTNFKVTNMHHAFEASREEAQKLGIRITGSEIVGLVPLEAILEAGRFYLKKQGASTAVSEKELIDIAIYSLGLNDVTEFDPEKKIIEYRIKNKNTLTNLTIEDFMDELASNSPAPGGGSVAALSGAISASLTSMVSNLTHNKKKYKEYWDEVEKIGVKAQFLKKKFLEMINKDTDVFNEIMKATKLPKKTDEEKEKRAIAIEEATKLATLSPLQMMETAKEMLPLIERIKEIGNKNAISDAAVSAIMLIASLQGAYLNILINIASIDDDEFKNNIKNRYSKFYPEILEKLNNIVKEIENNL